MQRVDKRNDALGVWIKQMLARRHSNVVACALANKMARIVWAILTKKTTFQSYPVPMTA
jgi:transposase